MIWAFRDACEDAITIFHSTSSQSQFTKTTLRVNKPDPMAVDDGQRDTYLRPLGLPMSNLPQENILAPTSLAQRNEKVSPDPQSPTTLLHQNGMKSKLPCAKVMGSIQMRTLSHDLGCVDLSGATVSVLTRFGWAGEGLTVLRNPMSVNERV